MSFATIPELLEELRTTPVSIIINSAGIATFGQFKDLDWNYNHPFIPKGVYEQGRKSFPFYR